MTSFKFRKQSYHAVKNPVFTLAQTASNSGENEDEEKVRKPSFFNPVPEVKNENEAALLKRRKTKQEQGDGDENTDPNTLKDSNISTNSPDPNEGSSSPSTRSKGIPKYEEIARITGSSGVTTSSQRPNYVEIGKSGVRTSPGTSPAQQLSPRPPPRGEEGNSDSRNSSSSTSFLLSPRYGVENATSPSSSLSSSTSSTSSASFLPNIMGKPKLPSFSKLSPRNKDTLMSSTTSSEAPLVDDRQQETNITPHPPDKKEETVSLRNQEEVCDAINVSRQTGEYQTLLRFFTDMYASFTQVLKVLKTPKPTDTSALNVNMEYLDYLHESMIRMPKDVRKAILRAIINCMLQDHRGAKTEDDIRGFLVFVLNPLFSDSSTYVIYAHVLRQICVLDADEQQIMIQWLREIPAKDFQGLLTRLRTFVNYKLFPTKNDIPDGEKSAWWVPNGVKVMALLNAANDSVPTLVPRKSFYIKSIESLDLVRQYHLWESGSQHFSFCQYPFCLPLSAKRLIIQKDSETKMLLEARQSLLHKFRQKQLPNMGLLFLNLRIRRKFLLEDSLREISRNQGDLKKKLRVVFTGEPGIDLGGVSKEWFFLITQRFFNEDYGMFTYNNKTRQWWFCTSCKENNQEYNLCGVLLGLAMYNGINLDIRFPMAVYKKLLSPAIVPYNNPHQPVGIAKFQMTDFADVFPELGRGLKELLEYDGNVEEDLCQTFMVSFTEYGQMLTRYLRPDGDKIPVTNTNREEYVNLYINYMMNKSIYKQFYSFYHGFHSVCASNALLLLRPEEIETLVIGDPDFNMSDLEKITSYDGYQRSDPTIRHFWEAVHDFNLKLKKKFLRFCTGNDRIPVGGMKEMKFKITKVNGVNATHMLPTAHTCFNQLSLPPYKSRKLLLKKLMIAVENAEGFGLE